MLGSFIASGAIIFGKVLLFIAVLGALVYMLHRGGVIDGIRNFFQSETFERVKEQFGRAFETIKVIGMAAYDVLKNVFEIFKILFTGEGDLLDAVGRLLTSLVKFVLIAIGGILKVYYHMVVALFLTGVGLLANILDQAAEKAVERMKSNVSTFLGIDPKMMKELVDKK